MSIPCLRRLHASAAQRDARPFMAVGCAEGTKLVVPWYGWYTTEISESIQDIQESGSPMTINPEVTMADMGSPIGNLLSSS